MSDWIDIPDSEIWTLEPDFFFFYIIWFYSSTIL